jgi:hypothetical protein
VESEHFCADSGHETPGVPFRHEGSAVVATRVGATSSPALGLGSINLYFYGVLMLNAADISE